MKKARSLWQDSMANRLCRILVLLAKNLYRRSFLKQCIRFIDKHIIKSRLVQHIIDPTYLTDAWYASFLYQKGTVGIRRMALTIPKPSLSFHSLCISAFLAAVLLLSYGLEVLFAPLFLLLAIYFAAHHAKEQTGTVFLLLNAILLVFQALLSLALPKTAANSLQLLLLGIDFFFLVSFVIRTTEDFIKNLRCIYCILLILCVIGLIQQDIWKIAAHATLPNGVALGEVVVLLFPFAFVAPLSFSSRKRQLLYLIPLLMLVFTLITATRSRGALIGFSVELLVLILLLDWRYLPLLLFLAPTLTNTALENIVAMWALPRTHQNLFVNLIESFRSFWQNGFGVDRSLFLSFYKGTMLRMPLSSHAVSPLYFGVFTELGLLGLFGFLVYLLRIAHNTLTSVFTADKELRDYFAAGFSMLAGISVSSLVSSTLFSPQILLTYWGMLGMLRAVRIIRYVDEPA